MPIAGVVTVTINSGGVGMLDGLLGMVGGVLIGNCASLTKTIPEPVTVAMANG